MSRAGSKVKKLAMDKSELIPSPGMLSRRKGGHELTNWRWTSSGKTILVPGCSESIQEHPRDFRVFKVLRVTRVLLNLVDMRLVSQSNPE